MRAALLALGLACAVQAAPVKLTPEALDALVADALAKTKRTLPPPQANDLLARRMAFDLTGMPPRAVDAHAVRADAKALEDWLAKTETGAAARDRLAARISSLLMGRRGRLRNQKFEEWVRAELERDPRVLSLWSRIVSTTGVYPDEGAPGWFVRFMGDPAELTTQVSRAMLGESIGCARCHDHPFARWKRVEFLGLAASFAQLGYAEQADLGGEDRLKVWDRGWGDVYADGGVAVPQAFPKPTAAGAPKVVGDGTVKNAIGSMGMASLGMGSAMSMSTTAPASPEPPADETPRRARLAEWLAKPDNPMPARALANRVWGWLMGRPVVTPVTDLEMGVDDLPGVLDGLAAHLQATGGDVSDLMRVIVRTKAYRARREDGGPFPPRRLSLEELAAALERIAERPGLKAGDDDDEDSAQDRLANLLENAGTEDRSRRPNPRRSRARCSWWAAVRWEIRPDAPTRWPRASKRPGRKARRSGCSRRRSRARRGRPSVRGSPTC